MSKTKEARVLSIQSHVVSGYVGNKSAVFPLQLLGIEVDIINTVHFSNHTGYKLGWEGERLDGEQLKKLLDGMQRNNLTSSITHILSGYLGSLSMLQNLIHVVKELKATKKDDATMTFVCDPVLGDNGKLYVPKELVDIYANEFICLADIITPNQTECELLAGTKIANLEDATNACDLLHDKGVSVVIITSLFFDSDILLLGSKRIAGTVKERFTITIPHLDGHFTGTGDMFSALVLAWSTKHPSNITLCCEKAVSTIQAVLSNTIASNSSELRIIQSKADIENPNVTFKAKSIL